ncbi:cobalamin-binding protein, partial [Streptomyces sp. SID9913]|nr:cobalamin-binding protein [Streptomyces sp. SID9913]
MTVTPSASRSDGPSHGIGARLAPATGDARAGQWAEKLWQAALAADEYAAADVVTGALDAGLDAETVLLE